MKSDLSLGDLANEEEDEELADDTTTGMSKSAASVVNGDVTDAAAAECNNNNSSSRGVNIVAAIQDHLSCTKSSEILLRDDKIALPCELDHMYANCMSQKLSVHQQHHHHHHHHQQQSSSEESQQVQQLRELLLLHLDFIQQQDEELRARDRQVAELKQEKEATS